MNRVGAIVATSIVVGLALGAGSCSSDSGPGSASTGSSGGSTIDPPAGDTGDLRQDVLTALTDEVMVPSYQRLADGAVALLADVQAACAALDDPAKLQIAQDSWSMSRGLWSATRAFRFGPATTLRTMSTIDFPIDPAKIDKLLVGDEIFTDDSLDALGSDQRGLSGIEHVLFGPEPLDEPSCSYLISANELVVEASAGVLAGWLSGVDGDPAFAQQLTEPGQGGMYATEHDAYEDLINNMIFAIADVADARIGRASGDVTGTPVPGEVDAGRARRAKQDAIDVIVGVRALFDGNGNGNGNGNGDAGGGGDGDAGGGASGLGVGTVVASISEQTHTTMGANLDAALAALEAMPAPLAEATDPAPAHAAYEALKQAQVTLRAEIASQLGITLTFGDADGDS